MQTLNPTPYIQAVLADSMTNTTSLQTFSSTVLAKVPPGCVVLAEEAGDFIPWDNPDNLISKETEQAIDNAVGLVFLPLLFLVSAPTNMLNMMVFWKHGLKDRVNLCLFSLSLTDFLCMAYAFLFNVDRFYLLFAKSVKFGPIFEFIISNYLGCFRGLGWVSGFISVLIACERCFCVVSPLRSQTLFKTRTTAVTIVVSSLAVLVLTFISSSRWSVTCVFDPLTNSTSKSLYVSEFYAQNTQLVDTISGVVVCLLLPLFYVIVISTTTIVTSVKLKRMMAWREQTSSSTLSSRELVLTRMLIGISVLYVVCFTPVLALGVSLMAVPDISLKGRYYNTFNLMITCFEFSSYVNSSANFFVYYTLGSKYKETLTDILRCGRRPQRSKDTEVKQEK